MHDDSLDGLDRVQSQKKFKLLLEASITYYVSQSVFPIYFSHFSSEWTEILHDDSLDGLDRVQSQKKFKLWLEASITYYVSLSFLYISAFFHRNVLEFGIMTP